jgi:hypothetical protein
MKFHIVIFIITMVGFVAGTLKHWTDLGGYIFMEPFLFIALDHLMEVIGWGILTSPSLDDYACWFGGLCRETSYYQAAMSGLSLTRI